MSKWIKWVIAAAVLLVLGLIICGVTLCVLGFNFGKLGTVKFVTKTYNVSEDFRNISIDADIEKVAFVLSNDGKCKVVCREEENNPHNVKVQGYTLTIEREYKHTWQFTNIGVLTETPEITVYLPDNMYEALTIDADTGNVDIPGDFTFDSISVTLDTGNARCLASAEGDIYIKTDTGHIAVSNLTAAEMQLASDTGRIEVSNVGVKENMNIEEDTGRVTMENVTCKNLTSNGDTGDLIMTNVIASGKFKMERSTGDIEFDGCDAETIYIETDTGDVSGTLLTNKIFLIETDTGKMNVPKTITGGRCEITTDTGNITIEIINK
jgi:DUF4097 and DUF4098 domain-containing protein YvlB